MISSLIMAAACGGGVCQPYIARQKVVVPYVAPYVAPLNVMYFVGAAVRSEAIVQKQLQADPDYKEFLEFKAWKQQAAAEAVTEPVQQNAVQMFCAKCHGTAEPKGGFYMDGQPGMSSDAILTAIDAVAIGKMPKDRKLTRDEKNAFLMDIMKLRHNPEAEQPPPEPEPSNPQGGSE